MKSSLQAHAPSTRTLYARTWRQWERWCIERGITATRSAPVTPRQQRWPASASTASQLKPGTAISTTWSIDTSVSSTSSSRGVRAVNAFAKRYSYGYHRRMAGETIIARARRGSGLSQRALAHRAGTSQPTLSTYESGTKSPTLSVVERIVHTSGYDLDLTPRVTFTNRAGARGEPYAVPDRLWRLDLEAAFAEIALPGHLYWSGPSRIYRLADRGDRARVYEIVLREGVASDLLTYLDGALLVDLWDDLVLPAALREAWVPVMGRYRSAPV